MTSESPKQWTVTEVPEEHPYSFSSGERRILKKVVSLDLQVTMGDSSHLASDDTRSPNNNTDKKR